MENRFVSYRATKSFQLNDGIVIHAGDQVEFDGVNVRLKGRLEFDYPQLRAAVTAKWLVEKK